ncbi:MAG: hypothetical protein LBB87_01740 [Nitrososphaerota archaeon]|nr:hypothetical protein [Nitrososphaerota archaeon]
MEILTCLTIKNVTLNYLVYGPGLDIVFFGVKSVLVVNVALKISMILFLGLYMQKTRKKLVNCKALAKLSDVFSKFTHKIKTALKPSTSSVVDYKKSEEK